MDAKINLYLSLIIKHFELEDETVESLYEIFDITYLTTNRIRFDKTSKSNWTRITTTFEKLAHNKVVEALKKYATEEALNAYMETEGFKYKDKKDIGGILAQRFIIYPRNESEAMHKYIQRTFKNRYEMWEFEHIENTDYCIAYD